ncbi:MAG: hypothetical protein IIA00_00440 [Proteobacteria bacterium]|nr:hypothetical protein [Pseudomonadota bacterium]
MRFIIITGSSHSGTTFVANLLSHARGIEARHEFFGGRTAMDATVSRIPLRTLSYYQPNHPMLELTLREQREQVVARFPELQTFVDVNSYLTDALDAARRALGDVLCFHLVRNGREVVRSQYNASVLYIRRDRKGRDRGLPIIPNDPSTLELWSGYSRFEKICWFWNDSVSRLLEDGVQLLHLERIVSDYQYLNERLLKPCGIPLERDVWYALKDKRLHRSRFRLKNLLRGRLVKLVWTQKHEARFMAICGETMRALGYG